MIVKDYRVGTGLMGDRRGQHVWLQVWWVIVKDYRVGTEMIEEGNRVGYKSDG